MVENSLNLVENPEFLALLDKHHLEHNISPENRVEVAVRMLIYSPTNLDAYLIAFGDVPETFKQFMSIVDFVKNEEDQIEEPNNLHYVLEKLSKTGKSIYPEEDRH
jgi:hypothetical protein